MWRTIIAVAVALIVAYVAIKLVTLLISIVFSLFGWLIVLAIGAAVAIPVYLYVRQRLLA